MNEIGTVITIEGTLRISVGPGLLYHSVAVIEAAKDGEPFEEVARLTADQLRLVLLYGGQALRQVEKAVAPTEPWTHACHCCCSTGGDCRGSVACVPRYVDPVPRVCSRSDVHRCDDCAAGRHADRHQINIAAPSAGVR